MLDLVRQFQTLDDPREVYRVTHRFTDVLVIALLASICGCDGWDEFELFAEAKLPWLKTFLLLEGGAPGADTFRRVISRINPVAFNDCFISWVNELAVALNEDQLALDGKTLRHSFDRTLGKKPLHLVRAWGCKNRLILGQVACEEKSNEITAVPLLLRLLNLKGALVSMDAMGCQKETAAQIVDGAGDYLLALKGNQGKLHDEVREHFEALEKTQYESIPDEQKHTAHDPKNPHGRIEVRKITVETDLAFSSEKPNWKNLQCVIQVESKRIVKGVESNEKRYYICSLPKNRATGVAMQDAVRAHWGVENPLHWVLDVQFREDENTIHEGHGPENMATLRNMAVNLLKQEKSGRIGKKGLKAKAKMAAFSADFLMKVLAHGFEISKVGASTP